MARQAIRPYEMSVWGLQDDFIITLSAPNITHKGQIIDPVLTNKDDGTQELSFSIPMYYFHNNEINHQNQILNNDSYKKIINHI